MIADVGHRLVLELELPKLPITCVLIYSSFVLQPGDLGKEVFLGYALKPLKKIVLKVIPTKRTDSSCRLPPHVPVVCIPIQMHGGVFNLLAIVRYVMDFKVFFGFIDPCNALFFVAIKFG